MEKCSLLLLLIPARLFPFALTEPYQQRAPVATLPKSVQAPRSIFGLTRTHADSPASTAAAGCGNQGARVTCPTQPQGRACCELCSEEMRLTHKYTPYTLLSIVDRRSLLSPPTAQLRAQNQAHVRGAILDAARALLTKDGVAGLPLRRFAAQIGYTPRTGYLYFADKDGKI